MFTKNYFRQKAKLISSLDNCYDYFQNKAEVNLYKINKLRIRI